MYRLAPSESNERALRRLLTGELDGALEWLGGADRSLDLRVHEARKHLKRARAVLDFGRSTISADSFAEHTRAARAAADELSPLRGRAALLVSLSSLLERAPELRSPDAFERVRAVLNPKQRATRDTEAPLEVARGVLLRARADATELQVSAARDGWAAWAPGFRRTYRAARRAYTHALRYPSARQLHAFRTAEKRHLYQVELLEPSWEGPLRAQRAELAELGELLGDHHDLSLLWQELERHPHLLEERGALKEAVEHRLAKLQKDALNLGARAFAEKPAAITRRFGVYFRAAFP